jgi:hypothetical protein
MLLYPSYLFCSLSAALAVPTALTFFFLFLSLAVDSQTDRFEMGIFAAPFHLVFSCLLT